MADVIKTYDNFTRGQLDERLQTKVTWADFDKGARKIENMVVQGQGALKRRFGTKFLHNLGDKIGGLNHENFRTFIFQKKDDFALLIFVDDKMYVFHEDKLVTTLTTGFHRTQVQHIDLAQTFDVLIIASSIADKRNKPVKIISNSFPNSWSIEFFEFKNVPTYDFTGDYGGYFFTIYRGDAGFFGVGLTYRIESDYPNFANNRYDGGVLVMLGGVIRILFGIEPEFGHKYAYWVVIQENFEITADRLKAESLRSPGETVFLAEPLYSDIRGWPALVSFYQSRLVFARTDSLPTVVSFSSINQFNNFDDSTPDDASSFTLLVNADVTIKKLIAFDTLVSFTTGKSYVIQSVTDGALTPTTATFIPQNNNGIADIVPAVLDSQLFYVEQSGNIVRAYEPNTGHGFSDVDISIISQDILNNPQFMEVYKSAFLNDGEYLVLSNQDGQLIIFQTNKDQKIAAWTTTKTEGEFGALAHHNGNFYLLAKRNNNMLVEKLDNNIFTDSSVIQETSNEVSVVHGLGHLNGKTVAVRADGFVQDSKTVENGKIDLEFPAKDIAAGLPYTATFIPVPVSIQTQAGNSLFMKQHVKRIYLDFYKSLNVKVDNERVPFLDLNSLTLGEAPTPKTGIFEKAGDKGWDPFAEIKITQDDPAPLTIRSIAYKIEI